MTMVDTACQRFLDEGDLVLDRLDDCAVCFRDKLFIFDGERQQHLSFGEFKARSDRIAAALAGLGLPRGAPVCVLTQNSALNALWMFAIWRAGGLYAPVNFNLRGELLSYQVRDSAPWAFLTDADSLEALDTLADGVRIPHLVLPGEAAKAGPLQASGRVGAVHALDELLQRGGEVPTFARRGEDLANIIYTSGTTGPSKGVLQTFRWIAQYTFTARSGLTEDDVIYCDLPLYHVAGAFNLVARALWHGNTVGLWNRFSASQFWSRIEACGATSCTMIGVMIPWLMSAPPSERDRHNTLNKVTLAPLPDNHHEIAQRFGIDFVRVTFGQTESGSTFNALIDEFPGGQGTPPALWKGRPKRDYIDHARSLGYLVADGTQAVPQGFIGRTTPLVETTILDENDLPCAPGVPGQIAVRPRLPGLLMQGYLNKPEATLTAFQNCWFHTGDLGQRFEDGTFAWVARMGDVCRVRGEKISLFEVETLVSRHGLVRQSAAVAVRAAAGGEDEIAVVVELEAGASLSADDLRAHNQTVMPRYMQPAHIFFVDALPQTPTGKVQKHPLNPLLQAAGLRPRGAA